MSARAEQSIGHYTILERLGEGGMGTVFKARDNRLERTVAVKMLSAGKADDRQRSKRFLREARSASALNHPNIVTVHDIGEHEGADYLVMEYVAGRTLAQCIASSRLAVGTTLNYAIQIADALVAAHQAHIVHCDLKPGNIMITESGLVKVLDFGLAKIAFTGLSPNQNTATMRATTQVGRIVGTFAYMSPEQAEGKQLDARSDIFSFGAVLYEMLTGRLAFEGDSSIATLAAVLRGQPKAMREIAPGVPPELEPIVERCLEKDRSLRFPRVADVKIALENVKYTVSGGAVRELERRRGPEGTRSMPQGLIPAEAVRAQVQRVLANRAFAQSDRLSRFLRFIVEKLLAGQADQLKEYSIGLEVYDRSESFDPRTDAIVRSEAHRLRGRLKEYYEAAGRLDPVVIDIPKGSYVPVICARQESVPLATASSDPLSIAVLPFLSLSSDPENEYFADGLTEEIIHALSAVEGLRVAARTSAFQFKGKALDIRQVGEQLGVGTVLEGSVRKSGERLRVTAQLTNAADGCHRWSRSYDRELKNVFAVQEEISAAIVDTLRLQLGSKQEQVLFRRRSHDFRAQECYWRGRHFWNRRSAEDLNKAVAYFEEATRLDPGFGLAYVGLADCYLQFATYCHRPPAEVWPQARQFALQALSLDEELAEAHTSLAYCRFRYEWDWPAAEQGFRRALQLDPGYTTARLWWATFLGVQGRMGEGMEEVQRAFQQEPLSVMGGTILAIAHYLRREYTAAIEQCRKALELDPTFHLAYLYLGRAQAQIGMFSEAIAALEQARDLAGDNALILGPLGHGYALAERTEQARALLDQLQRRSAQSYVPALTIAVIHLGLGAKDDAIDWLEKAFEERSGWLIFLVCDPIYEPLHQHPKFLALLGRMRLGPVLHVPDGRQLPKT